MKIAANKVITINYILKDGEGGLIEESNDSGFAYLHGHSNILPNLEAKLDNLTIGNKFDLTLAPEDAYGEYSEAKTEIISREAFGDQELKVGMQFHAEGEDGNPIMITINEVQGDAVTIDGNSPLAGITLNYSVEVMDIRDATAEELNHGHIHAEGESCEHEH